MAAGATDNGSPGARLHYDPRYYAGNVLDPDGYSLEFVHKSWQHPAIGPGPHVAGRSPGDADTADPASG